MLRRINALRLNIVTENLIGQKCCADWDFNSPEMKSDIPSDYPTREHSESPPPPAGREVQNVSHLYPIELTYEKLMEGVQYSFFNCYHNMWTKTSTIVYLKSLGIYCSVCHPLVL